jgi:hypothetical protein
MSSSVAPPAQFVFLIADVLPPCDPMEYAREALVAHWRKVGLPVPESADVGQVLVNTLPLVEEHSHPDLPDPIRKEVETRKQCALREVEAAFPLRPDEEVMEDVFTYLAETWENSPAGTVVLRRRTNRATRLFLIANAHFNADTIRLTLTQPVRTTVTEVATGPTEIRLGAGASPAKSIAADLAKKLAEQMTKDAFKGAITQLAGGVIAGGIASAIVNGLFDLFFPDKGENVFDAYFKGLEKIVRHELEQSVITQVSGTLTSLRNELADVYGPARQQHDLSKAEDRRYLFEHLQRYESTFFLGAGGMLGTLQQKDYKLVGFPVFLVGAGLHLAILQEMANVDPGNKAPDFDPLKSSYGMPQTGAVARLAKRYADFADATWPQIVEDRKSHISYKTRAQPVFRHYTHFGYYVDDLIDDTRRGEIEFVQENDKNGNSHYTSGHGPDDVKRGMESYIAARVKEMEDGLPERAVIVSSWRSLIDMPLNTKVK